MSIGRFSRTSLACALAAMALTAVAKDAPPVGSISSVQGNVSVGGNGFVAKAVRGTALKDGSVVMVATNGKATVRLNEACTVVLTGGQHLTIDSKLSCYDVQASVAQMFSPYQVAQAGGVVAGGATAGGAGGLGVVAVMAGVSVVGFVAVENDEKTSP